MIALTAMEEGGREGGRGRERGREGGGREGNSLVLQSTNFIDNTQRERERKLLLLTPEGIGHDIIMTLDMASRLG